MKNIITLVSTLLLTLTFLCVKTTAQLSCYDPNSAHTLSMFDIPVEFKSCAVSNKEMILVRTNIIRKSVNFTFPNDIRIDGIDLEGIIFPDAANTNQFFRFSKNTAISFTYPTNGEKVVEIYIGNKGMTPGTGFKSTLNLNVKSSSETYQSPDDIWTINTSQDYHPMCEAAAFPNGAPQQGFASVYIKYGVGHNGHLVRPAGTTSSLIAIKSTRSNRSPDRFILRTKLYSL